MINLILKIFPMIFHGVGQAFFGGGIIMFVYFIFFSNSDSKFIYAGISVICLIASFGIYFIGDKISDRLFWREKDKLLKYNKNPFNK
ncbi:Uncharacterised protein [Yersinia nurmii]|uniref:Uncharacterized protein n=1 Tax=Yersinia nurmii TaxID=685706 RepID=A0ABM9S8K3_9GAMM|nr:hypothetical protein [Yersinia nurmii]CNE48472.1 Uncharacterised protein [Yersinia nurmii]